MEVKLVLDTNAYCLCDLSKEEALCAIEEASFLFLPVIVYGELYYGFKYGRRSHENMRKLEKFIEEFQVQLISVDREVAKHFGDIYSSLRKKRKPIPTNDIWIAACSLAVSGTLLTADRHFKSVDQLNVQFIEEI